MTPRQHFGGLRFSDYKTAALGTWDRLEKFVPVGPHRETPPRSGLLLVSMLLEAFPSKQLQIFGLELGLPSPGAFWKYHYWSTKGRVAEDQMDYLKEQHPGVLQELECLRELRDGGWVDFVRASNAKIQ